MDGPFDKFLTTVTEQLKHICEGRYEATDEVLKFSDTSRNAPEVAELAETVGLMSVKLEAREMALEKTIEELRRNLVERRRSSIFFILFTFFITCYTFASAYLNQSKLSSVDATTINSVFGIAFLPLLILFAVVLARFSSMPLRDLGLTFRGSGRAIKESMLATAVLVGLITLVRWLCGRYSAVFDGLPFFDVRELGAIFWAYLLVAPAQEFIARGTLQTLIFQLMATRRAALWSVVLASLIFATSHTYFSFWISVLSIFGGFVWGWLYDRHRTIVGISMSHFIVGNYLALTGFWKLLL